MARNCCLHDRQYITFPHDQVILSFDLDFRTGIFAIQNRVAGFYCYRFIFFAGAGSDHNTTLWFVCIDFEFIEMISPSFDYAQDLGLQR
jgi:hypothetical protein